MPSLTVKPHKKAILVTGDTMAVKEKLKSLGGSWNRPLQGWCFPATKSDALVELLRQDSANMVTVLDTEIADPAASQAGEPATGGAAASESASSGGPQPSQNANASLTVKPHKKAILVTGDTMAVKEQLTSLGGSWNRPLQGWCFPGGRKDAVVELLRRDTTNNVTAQATAPAPKAKAETPERKRRSWELENGDIDIERYAQARLNGEYKRQRAAHPRDSDSDSDDYGGFF